MLWHTPPFPRCGAFAVSVSDPRTTLLYSSGRWKKSGLWILNSRRLAFGARRSDPVALSIDLLHAVHSLTMDSTRTDFSRGTRWRVRDARECGAY